MEKKLEFRSIENGFVLEYLEDWVVEGGDRIWVKPSETDFLQDHSSVLTEVAFTMFTKRPYTGHTSRKRRMPQPASEVAQEIADTMQEDEIIEPVKSVSINGRDGATSLITFESLHDYSIVLRIADDKVVVPGALEPASRSAEIQNILNAIALNIRPLSE